MGGAVFLGEVKGVNMPRYIDADDYKNRLRNEYDCETVTGLDAAVYVLDNMQTADVVERKVGKWVEYPISDGCSQCSNCGILRIGEPSN